MSFQAYLTNIQGGTQGSDLVNLFTVTSFAERRGKT